MIAVVFPAIVGIASASGTALARRSTDAGASAEARRADKLAKRARLAAEEGRYVEAIDAYEDALKVAPTSGLLLELANTHRLAGDCDSAFRYYERYLEADPWVKNRRTLEMRAKQMRVCSEESPPVGLEPEPEPRVEKREAPAPRQIAMSDSPHPGRASRIIGTTAAALGVSLLIGAVYYHVQEHNARARVDDLLVAGGMWSEHHDALEGEARRAHDMRNVLYVVGGVSAIGGSVLYYVGWREGQARVTLVPIAKGAAIHVKF